MVALGVHDPASVPERRTPAAPVRVGVVLIENEPAPLHLRITQFLAPPARHFPLVEREVHVLGRIPVLVVDPQGAPASGEASRRIGVRSAPCPAPPVASRGLDAVRGADALLVMRAVGPCLVLPIDPVARRPHPLHRDVGRHAPGEIEPVVGGKEGAGARPLPFVGIAEPLAHGFADERRLPRPYPDHRVGARDIGELELIYARLGLFGLLHGRIVEGCHVLGPADGLEPGVFVGGA